MLPLQPLPPALHVQLKEEAVGFSILTNFHHHVVHPLYQPAARRHLLGLLLHGPLLLQLPPRRPDAGVPHLRQGVLQLRPPSRAYLLSWQMSTGLQAAVAVHCYSTAWALVHII